MKIRINWGTGIVIAIVVMVLGMLTLGYIAVNQDYYLVEKDYYQKAINYQEQIDRINNADALTEKPALNLSGQLLSVQFPKQFNGQEIDGQVHIYSPVNADYDQTVPLDLDTMLQQQISMKESPKGRYTIKLEWTANEKGYYLEQKIVKE